MKKTALIGLIFVIVSLVFFHPIFKGQVPFPGDLLVSSYAPYNTNVYDGYNPGAVPNKAQGPDVIRQIFPWKYFSIDSFRNFEIPFWNPYSLSGNPLMANFQAGSFYPLNLIFFIFSFLDAWKIFIILSSILAWLFTYLFLKELGIRTSASVFAGFVFSFSSYMVVWMEYGNVDHAFLWLPLVLLILEKFIKKQSFISIVYLITVCTTTFLSGYIQGYFYTIFVGTVYFFARSILLNKISKESIGLFLVGLISPLFLSAFQLLPTIELFQHSSRGNYSLSQIDKLLNPFWYLITVIIPNFFGNPASRNSWFYGTYIERVSYFGIIPFILACYALLNFAKRKVIVIFGGLFVLSLFLATNLWFNKFIYLVPFPLISTTVPTRILSIFVFCGSILAGFGMQFLLEKVNLKRLKVSAMLIWFIIILSWFFVFLIPTIFPKVSWVSSLEITKRNLVIPTLLLALLSILLFIYIRFKSWKTAFVILLFGLTFFDLFYFFHKITPFSPKKYVYPKTEVFDYIKTNASINRVWGYGSGSFENNFAIYEKIFSVEGYEPLHSKRYGELISASRDGKISIRLSGSDANIHPGYGEEDLRKNVYRQQLLNILGVKYVLNKNDLLGLNYKPDYNTFPQEIYKLIWQKGPWQIYENTHALPRIFLASDYIVEKDKNKIIQMVFDEKFDLRDKIVLEEKISPEISFAKDNNAEVEVKKYSPNEVVLRTNAESHMLLFLSDNYYPGWRVSVDGKDGKIYRANYSFRAVPVQKGNHTVIFSYYPMSFDTGLKVGIGTFSILVLVALIAKYKKIYA